jgi:hypothetical protein
MKSRKEDSHVWQLRYSTQRSEAGDTVWLVIVT